MSLTNGTGHAGPPEPDDLPPDLMGIAAAAKLARCSPSQLWRWIRQGRVAGWRRLGRVFVSEADVRALFRRVEPPPRLPRQPTTTRAHNEAMERLREAGWA